MRERRPFIGQIDFVNNGFDRHGDAHRGCRDFLDGMFGDRLVEFRFDSRNRKFHRRCSCRLSGNTGCVTRNDTGGALEAAAEFGVPFHCCAVIVFGCNLFQERRELDRAAIIPGSDGKIQQAL